jgi:hypothetical protein
MEKIGSDKLLPFYMRKSIPKNETKTSTHNFVR